MANVLQVKPLPPYQLPTGQSSIFRQACYGSKPCRPTSLRRVKSLALYKLPTTCPVLAWRMTILSKRLLRAPYELPTWCPVLS
eukprot:2057814-Rhodomonas_salina.1